MCFNDISIDLVLLYSELDHSYFIQSIVNCLMFIRYRKYPNLVRTRVEIIFDPNYLVRILFER